ncbi:MAG: hypothetical protein JO002_12675 [Burkholderiaceae bacterium]|nr:hypothetical protein [Burkholderiaceae bacterium]
MASVEIQQYQNTNPYPQIHPVTGQRFEPGEATKVEMTEKVKEWLDKQLHLKLLGADGKIDAGADKAKADALREAEAKAQAVLAAANVAQVAAVVAATASLPGAPNLPQAKGK